MKIFSKILKVVTLVVGIGVLAAFFTQFATIISETSGAISVTGSQLAFGAKVSTEASSVDLAKSSDILLCLLLTVVAVVTAALNFTKSRSMRWVSLVSGVISAVYMLVIALSAPGKFVDTRPLTNVTGIEYAPFVLITAIGLLAFVVISAAFILVDDYVFVKESKNEKALVIPKKVVRFLREYKSEIKKIVWPGPKAIVKNTLIVLILCTILGVFIWLLDWGLGSLINIILDVSK